MDTFTKFISALFLMELMVNFCLSQEVCPNRQSVTYSTDIVSMLSNYPKWYVARTTFLSSWPYNIPPSTINTCAPLSYLQSCWAGAIHIDREFAQDGTISQLTSAFNPPDQTIVNYFEGRTLHSQDSFIFSGSINLMKLYQQNAFGQVQEIMEISSNFPPIVTYTEESQYSMLAYFEQDGVILWALYEDCDRELAWIEVNYWVVENNLVGQVNNEIDTYLNQRQYLNLPEMVPLSVELPFATPDESQ